MGCPEVTLTHTCILTGKCYKMSALFLKDFSILDTIEWGHFILPTASALDCGGPSGRRPAQTPLPLGETKPCSMSQTVSARVVSYSPRAASSLEG